MRDVQHMPPCLVEAVPLCSKNINVQVNETYAGIINDIVTGLEQNDIYTYLDMHQVRGRVRLRQVASGTRPRQAKCLETHTNGKCRDIVGSNKHGTSVTIFTLSTPAQLGCKVNVWRGCLSDSSGKVDYVQYRH